MKEKDKRARLMNEVLGGIKVQVFSILIFWQYYNENIRNI